MNQQRETIGERVKRQRERQGWILRYLADIAGVHLNVLKALESRNEWPGQDALTRIAAALGVNLEWLLAGDAVSEIVLRQKVHQLAQRKGLLPEQEEELFSQILPRIKARAAEVATKDGWITELEKLVSEALESLHPSGLCQLAKEIDYGNACLRCGAPYSGGARCNNCGMHQGGYGPD